MIRKTVFKNREEWLKHKNESFKLSSSNIGIILGYSEYMTPFQYWDKIKKGEITENTNTISTKNLYKIFFFISSPFYYNL